MVGPLWGQGLGPLWGAKSKSASFGRGFFKILKSFPISKDFGIYENFGSIVGRFDRERELVILNWFGRLVYKLLPLTICGHSLCAVLKKNGIREGY
jgi:hypothetical protein